MVRLIGYVEGDARTAAPVMVVEFAEGGELKKFLTKIRKAGEELDVYHRVGFALEIAQVGSATPTPRATKKSGNISRVGLYLDFVSSPARAEGSHGVYVQMGGRNRIDPRWG